VDRNGTDLAPFYYNLGRMLEKKGQTAEAIRYYREAIRLNPDDVDAHNNLGAVLDRKGHADEAIHEFQEAIRLKPEQADAITTSELPSAEQGGPTRPSASSRKPSG